MTDLPSPAQVTSLAALLAPGLIVTSIRSRAVTGSVPDFKDRLVSYGIISVGYFAAVTPFFTVRRGMALPPWLWSFLQYFAVPAILGIVLAYLYQHRVAYRVAARARLHLAHHLPASWDYAFEFLPASTYILVTLTDGTQVAGRWTAGSFASSSDKERDLLIGELWEAGEGTSPWTQITPARSVFVSGKDIRLIEFFGG